VAVALTIEVRLNGSADAAARYVGWAPSPLELRVSDADGATAPVRVRLRTKPGSRGRLQFRRRPADAPQPEVTLDLDHRGGPTALLVAGEFGFPSRADRDTTLEVLRGTSTTVVGSIRLMVRIRKDAETLTTAERGRFLRAMSRLNDRGAGPFRDFRNTHLDDTSDEAHGLDGFLPWHRAYLLDLERALQALDPSVTLPYWRFDRPAPKLFASSFIGAPGTGGQVRFTPSNPLALWVTDGVPGIDRRPLFDVATSGADGPNGPVMTEEVLVQAAVPYARLREVGEGNPHGRAHVSFGGSISAIGSAARDPLFFLLHGNVDRLWAKWQWFQRRFDATRTDHYPFTGSATSARRTRVGHNALDTMWPWNDVRTGLRPRTAPRQPFPAVATTPAPGRTPTVGAMLDYQGRADPARRLGFDYDDVPYEPGI
jgi:tyrosinase